MVYLKGPFWVPFCSVCTCCLWDEFLESTTFIFIATLTMFKYFFPAFKCDASAPLQPVFNCLKNVKDYLRTVWPWMKTRLKSFIWKSDSHVCWNSQPSSSSLLPSRILGVFLDTGSSFKFEKQVSSVVKNSFYQLHQIAQVKSYIPKLLSMASSPGWTKATLYMIVWNNRLLVTCS